MSEDGERPVEERLIGGRYRLAERIGSGPAGTVWRARDEQGEGYVAVKEPRLSGHPGDGERQRAAQRLLHEARAAARVDHPAAVAIHDVLLDDELPWIVMELVEGQSLGATLASRGPLPPAEAARIGLAVLGALHTAHRVGIVHRDLKPSNVLLEAGGERVVVTDFGIGGAQGHSAFVAPECGEGRGAGPASDLWSLGALLRTAVGGAQGPLGPILERLLAPEPESRPAAPEAAEVLAGIARVSPSAWVTEPPAPAPVATPAPAPTAAPPHPMPPEPRRLTPLTALGLFLARKPERG